MIPTLTTARLILRAPCLDDFPAFAAFYASPRSKLIGGPHDSGKAWKTFAADAGHWVLKGFGWFIIDNGTGAQGVCGLHHPPHQDIPELGWVLFDHATGKGYATEAAAAARDWAVGNLQLPQLVSYIDAKNTASQKVARRLGATTDGSRARHDPDCEIWRHLLGKKTHPPHHPVKNTDGAPPAQGGAA